MVGRKERAKGAGEKGLRMMMKMMMDGRAKRTRRVYFNFDSCKLGSFRGETRAPSDWPRPPHLSWLASFGKELPVAFFTGFCFLVSVSCHAVWLVCMPHLESMFGICMDDRLHPLTTRGGGFPMIEGGYPSYNYGVQHTIKPMSSMSWRPEGGFGH